MLFLLLSPSLHILGAFVQSIWPWTEVQQRTRPTDPILHLKRSSLRQEMGQAQTSLLFALLLARWSQIRMPWWDAKDSTLLHPRLKQDTGSKSAQPFETGKNCCDTLYNPAASCSQQHQGLGSPGKTLRKVWGSHHNNFSSSPFGAFNSQAALYLWRT